MTGPLAAEGVVVRLGGREALKGVSAGLQPAAVTCIVGPNGAGKSTLLACLAGLGRPDRGLARLGDADVLALPAHVRARRIGFLPQTPEVAWPVAVETLVALGRIPHDGAGRTAGQGAAAVIRAMALAGVSELAGRSVQGLSGGELSGVLLARALAGEPEWLLADEPFTGLDPARQLDVCDLLRRLAHVEGWGVVVTLHDLSMALRLADRVLVLLAGELVADGAPSEALSPEVILRTYGVEARLFEGARGPALELVGRHGT